MSPTELAAMLEPIPAGVMQTFITRGMMLSQLAGLQSKRTNVEADKQAAIVEYDATIADITTQINDLQKQIDALGG